MDKIMGNCWIIISAWNFQVLLRREQREIEIMRYRRTSLGSVIPNSSTALMQRKFPDRSPHLSHHGVNGNSVTHRFAKQSNCLHNSNDIYHWNIHFKFLRKITDQKRIAMSEKNNSNNCGWGNVTSPIPDKIVRETYVIFNQTSNVQCHIKSPQFGHQMPVV